MKTCAHYATRSRRHRRVAEFAHRKNLRNIRALKRGSRETSAAISTHDKRNHQLTNMNIPTMIKKSTFAAVLSAVLFPFALGAFGAQTAEKTTKTTAPKRTSSTRTPSCITGGIVTIEGTMRWRQSNSHPRHAQSCASIPREYSARRNRCVALFYDKHLLSCASESRGIGMPGWYSRSLDGTRAAPVRYTHQPPPPRNCTHLFS